MILNFPEIRLIMSAGTMLAANRRASSGTISRDEVEVFMGIILDGPWPKKNDPEASRHVRWLPRLPGEPRSMLTLGGSFSGYVLSMRETRTSLGDSPENRSFRQG